MTATTATPGNVPPRRARHAAQLEALRREHDSLRAQLTELAQRVQVLALKIQQSEESGTAPRAVPPGCRTDDGPALGDLIDALVRGVEAPQPDGSGRKKAPRPAGPPLRRLAGYARGHWPWLAVALGLHLAAGALLPLAW